MLLLTLHWIAALAVLLVGTASAADPPTRTEKAKPIVEVSEFLATIQRLAADDDARMLSSFVAYPVGVRVEGHWLCVRDDATFIQHYAEIFNKRIKTALRKQDAKDLPSTYHGVRVGGGEIWFADSPRTELYPRGGLAIIAINNEPSVVSGTGAIPGCISSGAP